MSEVKISFVATATDSYADMTVKFVESYKKLKQVESCELLLVMSGLSEAHRRKLQEVSQGYEIKIIELDGKSRCYRKDYGWNHASADHIVFMDVDCKIKEDYIQVILPHLNHPFIRGKNVYETNHTKVSKLNACYRTLCDDDFFRNELFTPNLILSKEVLKKVHGFDENHNIDQQDDYILSARMKYVTKVNIFHLEEAVVVNSYDDKLKKLMRAWRGYGLGYGYRFWLKGNKKITLRSFREFLPPFVCRKDKGIAYFYFAVYQWLVITYGYLRGLAKFKHIETLSEIYRG